MKLKLPRKTIRGEFVIIDSMFPQKDPFGFRNTEINEYLRRIRGSDAYAMYPMKPWGHAWFPWSYGSDKETYEESRLGYLEHFPMNKSRIHYLDERKKYRFKLAYSYFLAETYVLLPFYERNKIPFVFVLYPGGAFGINNEKSDAMVKAICASKYCKTVIVTQQITKNYLVDHGLCTEDKIAYIYGYFTQFKEKDVKPKKYYKKDKPTFDICFVAAKYTEEGVDKGYDLFIETAKILCKANDDVMIHVVGGFDENDIDVQEIKSRIRFYGYRRPDYLNKFYTKMDVFLSPNRPFKIFPGNFDGFPLGIDAAYCGTALFVSDELGMNQHYVDGEDIVIVPLDASLIANKINMYRDNPLALYTLSKKGQAKTQQLFDTDNQIDARINIFKKFLKLDIS